MVRHLFRPGDDSPVAASGSGSTTGKDGAAAAAADDEDDVVVEKFVRHWDAECIRRLKYRRDVSLGKLVLKALTRKRTARGAFDLLVDMGVWTKHEDVALLRSGFPVRFTESELQVAMEAAANNADSSSDPDTVLGLRKDLRHFKVYTIDGPSTFDIDDGISVEVMSDDDDGNDITAEYRRDRRLRYWIHIADVDRWAPRGSDLLRVAERRGTSLYLPTTTLCMFPEM
jgi:exoribonuclease-2